MKSTKRFSALLSLVVGVAGSIATPAAAGAAVPSEKAAVSCYGGASGYTVDNVETLGTFTASSRCRDINLRVTRLTRSAYVEARTCFTRTGSCNHWRLITIGDTNLNQWVVVADDVLDGTRFNVEMRILSEYDVYATVELAY